MVWFTTAMGGELGYDEIAGTDSDDTAYRKSLHPKDKKLVHELLENTENKSLDNSHSVEEDDLLLTMGRIRQN